MSSRVGSLFALALSLVLACGYASAQVTHTVDIGPGFVFNPPSLAIDVGDTVQWNFDGGLHNIESGIGGTPDGSFTSGAPTIMTGILYSVVFDQAFLSANPVPDDDYNYYCVIHFGLGQVGSILVLGGMPTVTLARGDCNDDNAFNIADAITVLSFLFGGGTSTINCEDACDSNDDGAVNIADAIFKLSALFSMGALPFPPHPGCGDDPTSDVIGCALFDSCP